MTYIFVFLGEFGFELLNWQAVVRKFGGTLSLADRIVCCSRASLYLLYEKADVYVNISELPIFQRSRAFVYWAVPTREGIMDSPQAQAFDRELKKEIRGYVRGRLDTAGELEADAPHRFVFSSDHTVINGCTFGRSRGSALRIGLANLYRGLKARLPMFERGTEAIKSLLFSYVFSPDLKGAGNIYEKLDLDNNEFKKIEADLSVTDTVEEKLGWRLAEPYVLCQIRIRETREISGDVLPKAEMNRLFSALGENLKVVLLSFSTGRQFDSYSVFDDSPTCFRYSCGSFPEQACLIHFASHLLFFTEGDFGSHIYVPPLMGRDVTAVAPRSVFEILATSPVRGERADALTFWNRKVYRFGGQVIPRVAEEVFATEERIAELAAEVGDRTGGYEAATLPAAARKPVVL